MRKDGKKELIKILKKKACGYLSIEKVDELTLNEGELIVTKRKITTREVAPDIQAVKLLLEMESPDVYSRLTDEQLEKEKMRLINLLKGEKNAVD